MGAGDVSKQDQNAAMFQSNPWNRPRDDSGWNPAPQSGEQVDIKMCLASDTNFSLTLINQLYFCHRSARVFIN